jgi:hypothetical protein
VVFCTDGLRLLEEKNGEQKRWTEGLQKGCSARKQLSWSRKPESTEREVRMVEGSDEMTRKMGCSHPNTEQSLRGPPQTLVSLRRAGVEEPEGKLGIQEMIVVGEYFFKFQRIFQIAIYD